MKISELITRLKRRLKDEGNFVKFSPDELLSAINQEENIIISDYEMNVCYFEKELSPEDNVLHLNKIALKVIFAKLNGKLIPLKNYKEHIKNDDAGVHLMAYSNMQSLAVLPKSKASGKLEVWANLCVFHKDENESLFLNDLFINLLIFSTMKNVLQSENSEVSMQKLSLYEELLKQEKARLKSIVSNTREEETLFSKVSRI